MTFKIDEEFERETAELWKKSEVDPLYPVRRLRFIEAVRYPEAPSHGLNASLGMRTALQGLHLLSEGDTKGAIGMFNAAYADEYDMNNRILLKRAEGMASLSVQRFAEAKKPLLRARAEASLAGAEALVSDLDIQIASADRHLGRIPDAQARLRLVDESHGQLLAANVAFESSMCRFAEGVADEQTRRSCAKACNLLSNSNVASLDSKTTSIQTVDAFLTYLVSKDIETAIGKLMEIVSKQDMWFQRCFRDPQPSQILVLLLGKAHTHSLKSRAGIAFPNPDRYVRALLKSLKTDPLRKKAAWVRRITRERSLSMNIAGHIDVLLAGTDKGRIDEGVILQKQAWLEARHLPEKALQRCILRSYSDGIHAMGLVQLAQSVRQASEMMAASTPIPSTEHDLALHHTLWEKTL